MRRYAVLTAVLLLVACSGGHDGGDNSFAALPQPENPVVEGRVTGGGGPDCCIVTVLGAEVDLREQGYTPGKPFFSDVEYDLAEVGYLQDEYFIAGTATSYINTAPLGEDGQWDIAPADAAAYRSRIVVHRPVDPEDFNGTVVVEWFNVSGGLDAAPDWLQTHTELVRSGYVWVGVTAQKVGIDGGGAFDIPLKTIDPERYGSMVHPGDSFAYDIFSQAAQAVRRPVGFDLLDGLEVERMVAMGQSQSAFYLVTYVNAVHPTVDLFDGFLIHSRGNGAAPLSQAPQAETLMPERVFIREDLDEPVITLQTETDIFYLDSIAARQPDGRYTRFWEVAGSAHADMYTTLKSPQDRGNDPRVADVIEEPEVRPPFITCDLPANDGPGHWVTKAAVHALDRWIRDGEPAPSAELLAVNGDATDFVLDAHGNVQGGIRTPYVDVPVATFGGIGVGPGAFCDLFGTTFLFDQSKLDSLYPTNGVYVTAINRSADAAVEAGFLLEADADLIKARAPASGIGGP